MWHLGRLDWITEDGGGDSGSDERRFDGNPEAEEEGRSRFILVKDLGGLNLDAWRSKVRGARKCQAERTLVGRAGEHGVEGGIEADVKAEVGPLLWRGTLGRSLLEADMRGVEEVTPLSFPITCAIIRDASPTVRTPAHLPPCRGNTTQSNILAQLFRLTR